MRTCTPWIAAAAVALAWTATAEGGPARSAPAKIAFVDVKRALNDSAAAAKLRADMKTRGAELQKPLAILQDQIRDLETKLETAPPGERARQLQLERLETQAELKSLHTRVEARLNAELALRMGDLYRRLTQVAGELAEAGGYDAVFRYAGTEVQAVTLPDLQLQIGTQPVLWHRAAHDLTDAAIKKLDGQ